MSDKTRRKIGLTTQIFIALFVGAFFGVILNLLPKESAIGIWSQEWIVNHFLTTVGSMFISSIKMLVVPLVLISLILGTASIGDMRSVGRVGGKTLIFYLMTTAIAIGTALLFATLFQPGSNLSMHLAAGAAKIKEAPSLQDIIIGLVPSNPFKALADGNMLQVIVFSIIFGLALASLGKKVEKLMTILEQVNDVVMRMIMLIMLVAPLGVFALVAKVFATEGFAAFVPLLSYVGTVFFVLMFHLFVVYTGALRFIANLSPFIFFKKFYSTMLFAFSTASSNATIPVTMETVEYKMGVDRSVASFTIPFGATINMDGTAIMQGVAVAFIAQAYGIDLSFADYMLVILTATLATVGTAGVPGVGLITLSMVLQQVNLPVEGIALIMGVDRVLDMTRTAVNITGDTIVTLIVGKSEKKFDKSVFLDPDAGIANEESAENII